ncbi:hypothetical protein [Aureibacter tunicatorum]|uniref:Multisubunit Na+/H+ antiporter MnhB subunit n=1 Tax=Aureibacter tunicatorum TaxID=866807 RepID=A0AAE3XIC7_9BACT|nr:hypothetical protein [Aureibacter tunicatorum]MDR6238266.1 multisubunit Na+/H+ antiporter MnhB subunit [Aureibacter tunicatorum]BDD03299.1 hypothetical protein AUTU_07820 [Aureibacter tunicatorum]
MIAFFTQYYFEQGLAFASIIVIIILVTRFNAMNTMFYGAHVFMLWTCYATILCIFPPVPIVYALKMVGLLSTAFFIYIFLWGISEKISTYFNISHHYNGEGFMYAFLPMYFLIFCVLLGSALKMLAYLIF